jgi:hypothetical protein
MRKYYVINPEDDKDALRQEMKHTEGSPTVSWALFEAQIQFVVPRAPMHLQVVDEDFEVYADVFLDKPQTILPGQLSKDELLIAMAHEIEALKAELARKEV